MQGFHMCLEFWNLNVSGDTVSGTLTDTHASESLSYFNILWAEDYNMIGDLLVIKPFLVDAGATLNGSVNDNSVQLQISGNAAAPDNLHDRPFNITVNVSR